MNKALRIALVIALLVFLGGALLLWLRVGNKEPLSLQWKADIYPGGMIAGKMSIQELTLVGQDKLFEKGIVSPPRLLSLKGQQLWTFQQPSGESIIHSCVGQDGSIYIGTMKNNVYAFDPTGKARWVFPAVGTKIWCCFPTPGPDGAVYVTASDGILYKLNADGTQVWRIEVDGLSRAPVSLGSDGTIYAPVRHRSIMAIDQAGQELWRSAGQSRGMKPPQQTQDGKLICTKPVENEILALNPDGSSAWVLPARYAISDDNAVTVDGNNIYCIMDATDEAQELVAFDSSSTRLWSYPCNSLFGGPAVDAQGNIAAVSGYTGVSHLPDFVQGWIAQLDKRGHCHLLVLSRAGKLLHKTHIPTFFALGKPQVLADGSILVLGCDGVMYCFK